MIGQLPATDAQDLKGGAMSHESRTVQNNFPGQILGTPGCLAEGALPGNEAGTAALREPYTNGADDSKRTVTVAIDPVALIITECITVTSAMRKHARFARSSVSAILGGNSGLSKAGSATSRPTTPRQDPANRKGPVSRPHAEDAAEDKEDSLASRWGLRGQRGKSMQDNPLMAGFGRLRSELSGCKGEPLG